MTTKLDVIDICSLVTLILHSVKVDFLRNTGNTFSISTEHIISECFGYSNSIYIRRWEHWIVMGSNFLNVAIFN